MEAMRQSWTDERLDDLSQRMDEGFRRVDADVRELRTEMNARFDNLNRSLLQLGGGVIVALIGLIATQL
jgi:hypothetical protein